MPDHDVVIVGGGAAGLTVASMIPSSVSAVIVSASPRPGYPPHCTGLVSLETARLLGVSELISEEYHYAVFLDSRLREICRIEGSPLAVRIPRPLMEEVLLESIVEKGFAVLWRKPVTYVDGNGCIRLADGSTLCGRRVLLASGYSPRFSKLFGLKKCWNVVGLEVRVRLNRRVEQDEFMTIHGSSFAPEFFAWIVPVGDGREALVGVAARRDHDILLASLLNLLESKDLLSISGIVSKRSGVIVGGPPAPRITAFEGKIVGLGDVLCASKPFTGGGLYAIARLAGLVAEYLADGSIEKFRVLEKRWSLLRVELSVQRALTKIARMLAPSPLYKFLLRVMCDSTSRGKCRLDYDEHSSAVGCVLHVRL